MKTNKTENDDGDDGCNAIVRSKCIGISKKKTHRKIKREGERERERTKSTITACRMKCLIVIMQSRQFIESMLWHELRRQERMKEEQRIRGAKETKEEKKNEERW